MSNIVFNTQYLNLSRNKDKRTTNWKEDIQFIVWHETANGSGDAHSTLKWNLIKDGKRGSYNYLISRDGTIYIYIDGKVYICYHAGVWSKALGYTGYDVNIHSLGVEIDGANDGTPIAPEQKKAIILLMLYFYQEYGIPLERKYHLMHKEVAPYDGKGNVYKSDPRGCDIGDILLELQAPVMAPFYRVVTDIANIRLEPSTASTINLKRSKGSFVVAMEWVEGQRIGASTRWLKTLEGFIHESVLEAVSDNVLSSAVSPEGVYVHDLFLGAWHASGDAWIGTSILTPGWPLRDAFVHDGQLYQVYERVVARCTLAGIVEWLHFEESKALLAEAL